MQITDVKLTDNSQEVLNAAHQQIMLALEAIGQEAEGYAKENCPVGSPESTGIPGYVGGRLRNSIAHAVNENEQAAYIGTNVEYAIYVEYGNYKHLVGRNHFLRDAASEHGEHYRSIMEASLKA